MSHDIVIHCNVLKCRKDIYHEEQACVTSCSHIFCLDCANIKFSEALVCPACRSALTQKNDIVLIQLSPSEEYKSSVLAGLSPDVIMDICNRALSFYTYQVSQEIYYREALQRSLQEHSDQQRSRLYTESTETNRLLKVERSKNQALAKENEMEKRRNHDLQSEIHSKSRQFTKLQQMYEKLKHKSMGSRIQQSVQDNASYYNPTGSGSGGTNENNKTSARSPLYLKPQQPIPYIPHRPAGHHDSQYQGYTNMVRNPIGLKGHGISGHDQHQNSPLSTIGISATKAPNAAYHSHRRPPASALGLRSTYPTSMYQHEKIQQQPTNY